MITMGGGYISCGDFMGGDKSGSALEGVLNGILKALPDSEKYSFKTRVVEPLLTACRRCEEEFEMPNEIVLALLDPLRAYHAYLGNLLGHPEPYLAPDLDRKSGLNATEAKYGKGPGWQYYCADDLIKACDKSLQTGESVMLAFD
jgi:hypothetical protein